MIEETEASIVNETYFNLHELPQKLKAVVGPIILDPLMKMVNKRQR